MGHVDSKHDCIELLYSLIETSRGMGCVCVCVCVGGGGGGGVLQHFMCSDSALIVLGCSLLCSTVRVSSTGGGGSHCGI